nr:acetyltransferase [Vibrio cholerae]
MVTVTVFEFGVMRCQPLRRALYAFKNCEQKGNLK